MKLNQIPEVMLKKKKDITEFTPITQHGRRCYNQALTAQGEVEVEVNRDKVLEIMQKIQCKDYDLQKQYAQALSDNLPKILRRKK